MSVGDFGEFSGSATMTTHGAKVDYPPRSPAAASLFGATADMCSFANGPGDHNTR